MSATIVQTRRSLAWRIWRAVRLRYLEWCEDCIREEREGYLDAGIPLGPEYVANSIAEEESLRVEIALLEKS